jgi:hypothetical protein
MEELGIVEEGKESRGDISGSDDEFGDNGQFFKL